GVLLLALALGVGLPPAPASAHAELVSTVPTAGAVLLTAPTSVELTFDEPVFLVPDGLQLYDGSGTHRTLPVSTSGATVRATLPAHLHQGSYVVGWRVVSDDSHPEGGVLAFDVGQASATAPTVTSVDSTPVDVLYEALNALGYLGLFGLVGLSVFDLVVARTTAPGRRLPRIAGVVAVLSYAALVPLTAVREKGSGLGALLTPGAVPPDWVGAAAATLALAGVGVGLMLLRPRLGGRLGTATGAAGAVVALASVLPVGHTRTFGPSWLVMGTDLVHASTAAVWLGGLIALVLYLARARRRQDAPAGAAAVVGRFSTLAGGLVLLLGLTGTALAVLILGSVPALTGTLYGRLLLGKLAVVAAVGAMAVWNRFRLVPRLRREGVASRAWRRLALTLRLEVVGLVLVLGLTSVLTLQNPRASATPDPVLAATPVSAVLGTGHLTGRFTPGKVGVNVLTFELTDAGGRPIVPLGTPQVSAAEPNLSLGPLSAEVRPGATPGSYRAQVVVPADGQWKITTAVRVSEVEQPAAVVDVVVVG
ncbi:MAG: copper resistance protein CopC/CopD, partial [Actinomycetota bacterium]|nr:copper resistance protein CopC/CopD [Actinomycetota bacterium]